MNVQQAAWEGIPQPWKAPCLVPMDGYVQALKGYGWLRFYEFWMGQGASLDAANIANAVIEGQQGIPIIARTNIAGLPTDSTVQYVSPTMLYALAAFFIVQPYSYFGASTGWYDSDWCWHTEYDTYRCGQPTGQATRTGPYSWAREFAHCSVTVNTSAASGSISTN